MPHFSLGALYQHFINTRSIHQPRSSVGFTSQAFIILHCSIKKNHVQEGFELVSLKVAAINLTFTRLRTDHPGD